MFYFASIKNTDSTITIKISAISKHIFKFLCVKTNAHTHEYEYEQGIRCASTYQKADEENYCVILNENLGTEKNQSTGGIWTGLWHFATDGNKVAASGLVPLEKNPENWR